jgi:hypothetical protein
LQDKYWAKQPRDYLGFEMMNPGGFAHFTDLWGIAAEIYPKVGLTWPAMEFVPSTESATEPVSGLPEILSLELACEGRPRPDYFNSPRSGL